MESINIKSSDYQRLFRLKGGIYFLLSDIFGGYYKNLNCLLTGIDGVWTSYLPKSVVEKTLADGLELLISEEKFNKYVQNFSEYKKRSVEFFENTLKKDGLKKEEVIQALSLLSEMFSFYSKTEFFYTDKAYMKLEENPSKELITNIEAFEEVKNSGRQYLNQLIFSGGYADQLTGILAKQFSVLVEELRMYKVEEVINLFDEQRVGKELLYARSDAFIQNATDGTMNYFEGDEAKKLINNFVSEEAGERTVKGVVANKGKKRGKVKVIPTDYYSDFSVLTKLFNEMDEGDILVAETTSPELMPACKKAGAIITDQGGLLSHAAIVSREMNIPCIVGTSNATEILKNGDMVEVDADNGVINIL